MGGDSIKFVLLKYLALIKLSNIVTMTLFASMCCDNNIERFTAWNLNLQNSKHPGSATIQTVCFESLNTYAN